MIPLTFSFVVNVKAVRNFSTFSSLLFHEVRLSVDFFLSFLNDVLSLLEEQFVDDDCENGADPREHQVDPGP